jgi:hypothetical protein
MFDNFIYFSAKKAPDEPQGGGGAPKHSLARAPPFGAHLGLFGGGKSLTPRISATTTSEPFNSSINSEIDRHDDGNVLIARKLLDALLTKIS